MTASGSLSLSESKSLQFPEKIFTPDFFHRNKIPCLILNALDDFLCLKENIQYDIVKKIPNYVLCTTEYGGHTSYNEGWFAEGNYMHRLTLDFFETVKNMKED